MYIVHCRVIVDNKCEFQHSSSRVACNFDARLVSKTRKYRSTKKLKKARLPTDSCTNNSKRPSLVNCISTDPTCRSDHRRLVCNHSLVLIPQVSALSVIARSLAVKYSPSSASVSAQNFAALLLAVAVTTLILKKTSALSVIIAHFWALKVIAKFGVSHYSKFRVAFAGALHIALSLHLALAIAVMIRSS